MKVTRPILIGVPLAALAAAAGYYLSGRLNQALLGIMLRYSTGVIGIVWAFTMLVYGKVFDITDMPGLRAREHANLEHEVRSWIHSFWIKGMFLLLMAAGVNLPQFMLDAKLTPAPLHFSIAFVSLAWSVQSIVGLFSDMEEIRRLRSRVKHLERQDSERAAASALLSAGMAQPWEPDPAFPNPVQELPPHTPPEADSAESAERD